MDSEEKELLKRLLKKVDALETKLDERDDMIQRIQNNRGLEPKKEHPEWGSLPKNDRLARLLIQRARDKVAHNEVAQETRKKMKVTIDELRKNFSFGELARFAIEKHMLREGKESSKVSDSGEIKVYED